MDTRTIYYIDPNVDELDDEVERALERTYEENLKLFLTVVKANFAMAGIDIHHYPNSRTLYFIDDEK